MYDTLNNLFARGVAITGGLSVRLGASEIDFEEAAADLGRLSEVIEALPVNQADYCFYRNRLLGTVELIETGEWLAARWQLIEMHRRLKTLAREYRSTAVVIARPRALVAA